MISCESECILFIILKEGSAVRLKQIMLACMARRKKGRELSAPLSLNSLHALKIMLACLARENRGRVSGREKVKSSPLEIDTFLPFPFLSYIPLSTPAKQV